MKPSIPTIQIEHLTKRFGSKTALSDVSFNVPRGSMFGFLGPNGAGKTTTIRCMMDFIRPTSGKITLFGQDARHNPELKKLIGFLPSDAQLNQKWTVEEHLRLLNDIRGSITPLSGLFKQFELDKNTKVRHLSTGNKQKLSLLLAFAGSPQLLIMDEPTRGLDPVLQNTLYALLEDFVKQGNTVFLSSHNLSEVQRICDEVMLIKDGHVVTEQSVNEIIRSKVHLVSAVATKAFSRAELVKRGADIIAFDTFRVSLKVPVHLNDVIGYLTEHNLVDLSVTHYTLEDIFLEKYTARNENDSTS